MKDELAGLAGKLFSEGEKTASYFKTLTPEAWDQQVYTTGSRWTVRHILAHFLSAERALGSLFANIIQDGSGAPKDFDIDRFNESQVDSLMSMDPPAMIDSFLETRGDTVTAVEGMAPDDLNRIGNHPWFGEYPLRDMIKLVYRHNMIHLRDVRRALGTGQPVPHLDVRPPAEEQA